MKGKIALVTGGSRGLGEMIARAYVENGAKVYITARKADACKALAKSFRSMGECIAIPADLSRMDEIDAAFRRTSQAGKEARCSRQ